MASNDQVDFQELLDLARDKSVDSRTRLVQIVGDLFFDSGTVLSDRERALMSDILRQLIHDVEMSVRRLLAERLATEADAPAELISALANDEIEVAHKILVKSSVLQDIDLIEIIEHRTLQHQLAIATRRSLSENVSDALVETTQVDVIKTLLENHGAEISQSTMEYLVEESQRVDAYQNPLLHRNDLTPDLAKRMYWWVSAALRDYIVDQFKFDPTTLEDTIEGAVHDIMAERTADAAPESKAGELAKKLQNTGTITPTLLIDTVRQGEVALFEGLFAELVGLSVKVIQRLIYEPGGQAMAIVCRSIPFEKGDFASIFLLSRSARPGDKVVDPNELSQVLEFFDRIAPENARKVLRRWRLDPNFRLALEQVGGRRDQTPKS